MRRIVWYYLSLLVLTASLPGFTPAQSPVLKKCWEYRISQSTGIYAASDNDKLLIIPKNNKLDAISTISPKLLWSTEITGDLFSNIVSSEENVYFVSGNSQFLRSHSSVTGIPNWTIQLPSSSEFYLVEGKSLVAVSEDGEMLAVENNGNIKWRRKLASKVTAIFAGADSVVVGTADGKIHMTSILNGEIRQTVSLSRQSDSLPYSVPTAVHMTSDGKLLAGDDHGKVSLFDKTFSKAEWTFRTGGKITSISESDGGYFITSLDNFLYLLSTDGNRIWKRRFAGRIIEKPAFYKDLIVLTSYDDRSAFMLDKKNGKIIEQIQFPEGENFVNNALISGELLLFITNAKIYSYSFAACGLAAYKSF